MKPTPVFREDEVTSQVRVIAISDTQPAQVTLAQCVRRPDGKERIITQKIPVLNADLLARLAAEASPGTDIEATIITEWHKNGYTTHLANFRVATFAEPSLNEVRQQPAEALAKAS